MGYATVRAASAAYMTGNVIPGLNVVHSAKPLAWPHDDWVWDPVATGRDWIANGFVHVERDVELRAATGKRFVDYDVALVLRFQTRRTGPTAGEDAQDDYDALIDAVKARLRVKTAGMGPLGLADQSTLWQAAERLLEAEHDLPRDDPIDNETWGVVRFDVSEWITA